MFFHRYSAQAYNGLRVIRRFSNAIPSKKRVKQELSMKKLPPQSEWRTYFPNMFIGRLAARVSLANQAMADRLAEVLVPPSSTNKVVIEAFPGPGCLTRALLKLPKTRLARLIVLEDVGEFLPYLKPLEHLDERVTVIPLSGHDWNTYTTIERDGLLNVEAHPWHEVHPSLQFVSHLTPTAQGEQLMSQFLRLIPEQQWLFKFGRIPMGFLLSEHLWKRLKPDTAKTHCKLSVIAGATVDSTEAISFNETQPFAEFFHPSIVPKRVNAKMGNSYGFVEIIPLESQVIPPGMMDKWDYCLRHLFVNKSSPLTKAILSLGPGAQTLLPKISNPMLPPDEIVDAKVQPLKLTTKQWATIVKAFDEWPFAPENLSAGNVMTSRQYQLF